jgi:hypothetical protein
MALADGWDDLMSGKEFFLFFRLSLIKQLLNLSEQKKINAQITWMQQLSVSSKQGQSCFKTIYPSSKRKFRKPECNEQTHFPREQ